MALVVSVVRYADHYQLCFIRTFKENPARSLPITRVAEALAAAKALSHCRVINSAKKATFIHGPDGPKFMN